MLLVFVAFLFCSVLLKLLPLYSSLSNCYDNDPIIDQQTGEMMRVRQMKDDLVEEDNATCVHANSCG